MKALRQQIAQTEADLIQSKSILSAQSKMLKEKTLSPTGLFQALLTGFMIGFFVFSRSRLFHDDQKNPGSFSQIQSKPPSKLKHLVRSPLLKILLKTLKREF